MAGERSVGLWIAVVTGILTILSAAVGNAIKGINDIRLEHAQLDSRLILNALDSPDLEQRRASLRFLVESSLIRDEKTARGLRQYFEGESPKSPPQLRPFIESGTSRVLTPPTPDVSANTDVDLFVCGKDKADSDSERMIARIHSALRETGRFGASKLKVWDRRLYDEIPLSQLDGSTTIVVDAGHPENTEIPTLESAIGDISGLPPIRIVDNRGPPTPWRISVVLCK